MPRFVMVNSRGLSPSFFSDLSVAGLRKAWLCCVKEAFFRLTVASLIVPVEISRWTHVKYEQPSDTIIAFNLHQAGAQPKVFVLLGVY